VLSRAGVLAYAGAPLTDAGGRTLGALCVLDLDVREWTPGELALLRDLAAVCSSELRLRIAREVAEDARQRAVLAHDRLALLATLTETLASTLDVDEALRRLASMVVPRLADWCSVTLLDAEGRIRRVACAHHDPARTADTERLTELLLTAARENDVLRTVQLSGRPHRASGDIDDLRRRTGNDEVVRLAARLGYAAHLTAPIVTPLGRRVQGGISLLNGPGRAAFTEADERIATDIGRRAGLAIDNSRLYRWQRHVAEVLQRSMLTDLPSIPDVGLHARYLPARAGDAVGGDWYDAFAQPDGSVMVAVGDVAGHDIEAAATMGQLRNLLRGDAFGRSESPGALLSRLDRAVYGLGVAASATMVLARLTRVAAGYRVDLTNAGHPPPLVLRPDGEVEVWWATPEPLLGLRPRRLRTTRSHQVPAGSTLVLYTDGLVEDPSAVLDAGIERLAGSLRGRSSEPGEELCSRLVAEASRRADDIALLLVHMTGEGGE
jgi:GAF domain-containing protein